MKLMDILLYFLISSLENYRTAELKLKLAEDTPALDTSDVSSAGSGNVAPFFFIYLVLLLLSGIRIKFQLALSSG